jgi:hypothetical protein
VGSIVIDDSRRPIIVVRFDGLVSDAEFERYLGELEAQLEPGQRVCTILDARLAGRAPPRQRKLQADWLARNAGRLRESSVGSVFVITSALVRGVLTAIMWLQPMPVPHAVVATMDEAERWAESRLAAAGS